MWTKHIRFPRKHAIQLNYCVTTEIEWSKKYKDQKHTNWPIHMRKHRPDYILAFFATISMSFSFVIVIVIIVSGILVDFHANAFY